MTKGLVKKMVKKKEKPLDLTKIVDSINEGNFKLNTRSGFIKKYSFSPSTIVFGHGYCPRYWYLAFEGGEWEDKNNPNSYSSMNAGSDRHERLQSALEASGILEWKEQEIKYEDPPIFGYSDAMVKLDDQLVLLEIKTTKEESFQYHKQNGTASRYHIEQLLIYMKILKQQVGAIVYESKNTHELCVIPVVATQQHVDFIDYLFDWLRKVRKAFDDKQLPERGFRQNSKTCKSCPLESVCDSKEKGVIKIERRKELE